MVLVNNVTGIFWVNNGSKTPLNSLKYRRNGSEITMLLEIVFLDQTLVSTVAQFCKTDIFRLSSHVECESFLRWYIFADVMSRARD